MLNKVKIAIDAMGGENSPRKIIEGIEISLKSNQENFFYLYGNKNLLEKEVYKKKIIQEHCEIIATPDIILDDPKNILKSLRNDLDAFIDNEEYKISSGIEARINGFSFYSYPTAIEYSCHIPIADGLEYIPKQYLKILFNF